MTAVTVTEISSEDMPMNLESGTGKRRKKLYIRGTSTTTGDTLDLTSYVSNLSDVEGVFYNTVDNASVTTYPTWSTTTVTMAQHTGSGVLELGLIVNLT